MATPAWITSLENARDDIASVIETEMEYQRVNGPKPSYSANGRSVSWNEWLSTMMAQLKSVDELIATSSSTEPYEIHVTGYT